MNDFSRTFRPVPELERMETGVSQIGNKILEK